MRMTTHCIPRRSGCCHALVTPNRAAIYKQWASFFDSGLTTDHVTPISFTTEFGKQHP